MAYVSPATVHDLNTTQDGDLSIVFAFSGNAGEPTVLRTLAPGQMDRTGIRNWIYDQIQALNAKRSRTTTLALSKGETIAQLAPVAATPTAYEAWRAKAERLKRLRDLQVTAAAAEVAALEADVEATYEATFAAQV